MRLLLALAIAATAACDSAIPSRKHELTIEGLQRAADAQIAKTPQPRTYTYPDGELRVVDVPVRDTIGLLKLQRCFLWRDREFRAATLSCGQMPDGTDLQYATEPPDPPEIPR